MERVELDWSLHKAIFEMFPGPASTATTLCFFFFFFNFIFKLYKILLVLPNIEMNLPQVYMCSLKPV